MVTGDRTPARVVGATALTHLGDEELIERMARGDPGAFEVIYHRHCRAVFSLACRICPARATAEEVSQDAFMSIWRGVARYDGTRGSVRSWLLTVVHHRAIDALRRSRVHERRRVDEHAAQDLEAPERTEAEVARRVEACSVRAVIDELPAEQRRVVDLAYFGGLTHAEIAELLQAPLGTVKGRMRLALQKMRAGLELTETAR